MKELYESDFHKITWDKNVFNYHIFLLNYNYEEFIYEKEMVKNIRMLSTKIRCEKHALTNQNRCL